MYRAVACRQEAKTLGSVESRLRKYYAICSSRLRIFYNGRFIDFEISRLRTWVLEQTEVHVLTTPILVIAVEDNALTTTTFAYICHMAPFGVQRRCSTKLMKIISYRAIKHLQFFHKLHICTECDILIFSWLLRCDFLIFSWIIRTRKLHF